MMPAFQRRLFGYRPAAVAQALARMESEQADELRRLNEELVRSAAAVSELRTKTDELEAAAESVESRIRHEITALLQSQEREQLALQEASRQRAGEQENLLKQVMARETELRRLQQLRATFSHSFCELVQRFRSALSDQNPPALPLSEKTIGDSA